MHVVVRRNYRPLMAASDMREANTMTEAEARAALAAFDGPGGLQAWIAAEAPKQRARLVLATWRGPAEPRPPGVPATPRPL